MQSMPTHRAENPQRKKRAEPDDSMNRETKISTGLLDLYLGRSARFFPGAKHAERV